MVNLIFSGMRQKIREAVQGELVLEKVFAVLKGLREDQTEESLLLRLGDYTDELLNTMEKKKEQGLLERKEELSVRKAAGLLRAYEKLLKRETQILEEGKFEVVRAAFERQSCLGSRIAKQRNIPWNMPLILWKQLFTTVRKW